MYVSGPQKRIGATILVSTAIIAGALILRGDTNQQNVATVVNGEPVVVTEAAKREAIPIADSNGDGVPDWQEALQNTAPVEVTEATSSFFMEPTTLTDQFALQFFEQMVRNEQYGDFGAAPEALVQNFSTKLAATAVDKPITEADILESGDNSPAALAAYGERLAIIMLSHDDTSNENEAVILERALRDNNPEELRKLDDKISVYRNILTDTLATRAPSSVALEHVILLNAYQAILNDLVGMRNAFADPMEALLRVKRYQEDADGLARAIVIMAEKLTAGGAQWPANSPVYQIISTTE